MSLDGPAQKAARDLGQGWKVSPYIRIEPEQTFVLAEIQGPGAIQQIWMTPAGNWRFSILRFYWDDEETPSIEAPLGDLFCNGHALRCNVTSLPIAVNPSGGFNSYWPMPFRGRARITVENQRWEAVGGFFYQISYALTEVPDDAAYFHAQWRRGMTTRQWMRHHGEPRSRAASIWFLSRFSTAL